MLQVKESAQKILNLQEYFSSERQFATILYQLHKAERQELQECLPNPTNGRLLGLLTRCLHLLDVRCKSWVLANRIRRQRQEMTIYALNNELYGYLGAVPRTARSEKRIEHVPTRERHSTINSQVDVCPGEPGLCLHLLNVDRRTPGPPTDRRRTSFKSR